MSLLTSKPSSEHIFGRLKNALGRIGYGVPLLHERYEFSDLRSPHEDQVRSIPLAGFAQDPPSYRNACLGVAVANGVKGEDNVARYWALGAPLILEIDSGGIVEWSMTAIDRPKRLGRIELSEIEQAIDERRVEWSPRRIYEAKTSGTQLDFIDVGLFPILEGMIQEKLHALLMRSLVDIKDFYERDTNSTIRDEELFRLVFRFIAAKVLRDRREQGAWNSSDPHVILSAIEDYYGFTAHNLPTARVSSPKTIEEAWRQISRTFHFENLSVDDLAFVYENTLVDRDKRKVFGIHSTPPQIAEYILRKLPVQDLEQSRRRVLEPCSGHGIFLVSAMRRLRDLLPLEMTPEARHGYFRNRLVGLERDSFAREVSLLCLMLADYPNPNGWKLYDDDVFSSTRLDEELERADIVLCNPPFEKFSAFERARYKGRIRSLSKPAEVLNRVMAKPPSQLGFVLPRRFTTGATFRSANRRIAASFANLEIVALPDKVFTHSDSETVLLMAWGPTERNRQVSVTTRTIREHEWEAFSRQGKEPQPVNRLKVLPSKKSERFSLWVREQEDLWEALKDHPKLESVVRVVRGIQWKPGLDPKSVVSRKETDSWLQGYASTRGNLSQFRLRGSAFINPDPGNMLYSPMAYPWEDAKTLVNALANSRGPWRIAASTEVHGALVTQAFHALFPLDGGIEAEIVTALLNSPVANAWAYDHGNKRHNTVTIIESIPIPPLDRIPREELVRRVSKLEDELASDVVQRSSAADLVRDLLFEIDALILHAYDLPPRLEDRLLAIFRGFSRPPIVGSFDYAEELARARESLNAAAEHARLVRRYQELVNRSFETGLGAEEAGEAERLSRILGDRSAPVYLELIDRLRSSGD